MFENGRGILIVDYRKLGVTGLWVSEVSFGTIPVLKGNVPVLPQYYNLENEQAVALMRYAWDKGCNLYDTAIVPEYGDAEIKLGMFAKAVDRKRLIISDKARFFDGGEMYRAVEQSIENLGEIPDIYFVHQVDLDNVNQVFGKYGALDALVELKKEGKIKFTGVASHYYDVLIRAAKDKRVDVLQGSGNLLERGMLERMAQEPDFQRTGMIINKVYAAGLLPGRFTEQELIGGVLSYPVSTALLGIGTIEQADKAFSFYGEGRLLSWEHTLERLEQEFYPICCDRCQRCVCPKGTEIHTLFRQSNYYYLGKDYWALRKLDLGIRESAENCKKCTELRCMYQCPKGLWIPQIIQEIAQLVGNHYKGEDTEW